MQVVDRRRTACRAWTDRSDDHVRRVVTFSGSPITTG